MFLGKTYSQKVLERKGRDYDRLARSIVTPIKFVDPDSAAAAKAVLDPFRSADGKIELSQNRADNLEMKISEVIHQCRAQNITGGSTPPAQPANPKPTSPECEPPLLVASPFPPLPPR